MRAATAPPPGRSEVAWEVSIELLDITRSRDRRPSASQRSLHLVLGRDETAHDSRAQRSIPLGRTSSATFAGILPSIQNQHEAAAISPLSSPRATSRDRPSRPCKWAETYPVEWGPGNVLRGRRPAGARHSRLSFGTRSPLDGMPAVTPHEVRLVQQPTGVGRLPCAFERGLWRRSDSEVCCS
jgi:hypothetical protein